MDFTISIYMGWFKLGWSIVTKMHNRFYLLMFIVQILRMILNYVLLSQFEFTLENFNIINLISFTLVGLSLILFLKDNSLYNKVRNRKITEAFEENKNNILIEKCKLILFVVVLSLAIIVTYCTKGYVLFNVTMMTLSVLIVPIFEELFLENIYGTI